MRQAAFETVLSLLEPGRSYYVPKRVDRSHPLWGQLDIRIHQVLCAELGGTSLYAPLASHLDRRRRACALSAQGYSAADIATHLGVSVRTVQLYVRHNSPVLDASS